MNPIVDYLKAPEEREKLKRVEQLRRKGERFIRIRYEGTQIPQIDSEGLVFNIRIHGLEDIEAYEYIDQNTGKHGWGTRKGARALLFHQSSTGDIEADVWDDPGRKNRHFLSTHPELVVVDENMREEISEERKRPFKAELSHKEELEREIAARVKELDEIVEQEKAEKKSGRNKNGVNKPTSDVDSA